MFRYNMVRLHWIHIHASTWSMWLSNNKAIMLLLIPVWSHWCQLSHVCRLSFILKRPTESLCCTCSITSVQTWSFCICRPWIWDVAFCHDWRAPRVPEDIAFLLSAQNHHTHILHQINWQHPCIFNVKIWIHNACALNNSAGQHAPFC